MNAKMYYGLFRVIAGQTSFMGAEIRFNRQSGDYCIYTEMEYTPIDHHPLAINGTDHVKFADATQILADLNFVSVKEDFSPYNLNDVEEIKDILPAGWYEMRKEESEYI